MIKPLEDALGKVSRLSEHKQAVAAEQLAQGDGTPYALSLDERAAVREALTRTKKRQFASDAEVDKTVRRSWK